MSTPWANAYGCCDEGSGGGRLAGVDLTDAVGFALAMNRWVSGAYRENLPASDPFPTSVIWYQDATKAEIIVSKLITFDAQHRVTSTEWKVYDFDGITLLATVTDVLAYSGASPFELNRTRTIT